MECLSVFRCSGNATVKTVVTCFFKGARYRAPCPSCLPSIKSDVKGTEQCRSLRCGALGAPTVVEEDRGVHDQVAGLR